MYNVNVPKADIYGKKSLMAKGADLCNQHPRRVALLKRITRRSLRQSATLEITQGMQELLEKNMELSGSWFTASPFARPQYYGSRIEHEVDMLALAELELEYA